MNIAAQAPYGLTGGSIPSGTTVATVNSGCTSPCVTLNLPPGSSVTTGSVDAWVSGGYTITLSANASATGSSQLLTVNPGLYRMVGALNTISSMGSPIIVPFTQNNDTFYLNTPAADVNAVGLSSGANTLTLASVPNGIVTEAMGRCVASGGTGTNYVLLYTPPTSPGNAASFPTVPGYAVQIVSGTADTAYPYRLHTNTTKNIYASANSTPTLNCMTDGWVWKRSQ
jgi:hypothetical protein